MDHNRLQHTLRALHTSTRVQLAFVIDKDGGLIAWVGRSSSFSPMGQFPPFDADQERNENLYLTVIGEHYLGVLFEDGIPMEDVRSDVEGYQDELKRSLGYA
ncbi:MAG: hypothetical protein CMH57_12535 [Myxococcales bacterium]|nr:hypothetical protein [Myxococcales bacterium]